MSSFIVRLFFIFASLHSPSLREVRESGVCERGRFPSSFLYLPVRLAPSFVRSLFVSLFRYYTPSPWERAGVRIFCSSFVYLPVRLAPACRATTSYLPFCHLPLLWYSFRYIPAVNNKLRDTSLTSYLLLLN